MKIVRENILVEKFTEYSDPISDMKIGIRSMSAKQAAELTVRTFKPFGISVYYRLYNDDSGQVYFDLYDSITEKEFNIGGFTFYTEEAAKAESASYLNDDTEDPEAKGGWFFDDLDIDLEEPTFDLNKILQIVLQLIYGKKEAIDIRLRYLENVKRFYKENK